MAIEDPQQTWNEYYERKKTQRVEEASALWSQLVNAGVTEETVLALDFAHFANSRDNADALAHQLSENYTIEVKESDEEGYYHIKGTTRPHGVTLTKDQHLGWVEFMADAAKSNGCVFSTWSLEAPSLSVKLDSEDIESAS